MHIPYFTARIVLRLFTRSKPVSSMLSISSGLSACPFNLSTCTTDKHASIYSFIVFQHTVFLCTKCVPVGTFSNIFTHQYLRNECWKVIKILPNHIWVHATDSCSRKILLKEQNKTITVGTVHQQNSMVRTSVTFVRSSECLPINLCCHPVEATNLWFPATCATKITNLQCVPPSVLFSSFDQILDAYIATKLINNQ